MVARELSAAGVIGEPVLFELIGRLHGNAPHIKAGNYEFESPTTPLKVLQKITRGDATQVAIRFIDGWTFKQMRAALDTHESIKHDTLDMSKALISTSSMNNSIIPASIFVRSSTSLIRLNKW